MTSIVTLTLNPAIDQTIALDHLVRGAVHRAHAVRYDAGGKGVNVASCLADYGVPVVATGLLGRDNAGVFELLLTDKGIVDRFVRVEGGTRTNLKLVDASETTDINLAGLDVSAEQLAHVDAILETEVGEGQIVVLSGSLPLGCPPDHYAELLARLADKRARILLDASGPAFQVALCGPARPYCVKPNRAELAEWAGRDLPDIDAIVIEARRLQATGIPLVVVSLGEEGALFLGEGASLWARLPAANLSSTVGAGDAMVAGIAAALLEDRDIEGIARTATAFAVAKLGRVGPHLPELASVQALIDEVMITPAEPAGAVQ